MRHLCHHPLAGASCEATNACLAETLHISSNADRSQAVSQTLLLALGRLAAKKYLESIKTIDQGEKRQPLIKWIESKCMEIGHSLVGHKVKVWWPAAGQGKGCYYSGQVTGFDDVRKDHHIHYDDTNEEDLWLAIESWKDLGKCLHMSCC